MGPGDEMQEPRLVLASGSPRRADLLRQIGLRFEVLVPELDEERLVRSVPAASGSPAAIALLLARAKAREIASCRADSLILAADTVVVSGAEEVLGKPADDADALRMLCALSGRTHRVITGTVLLDAAAGTEARAGPTTRVRMRTLPAEVMAAYVASGEPRGKAGGYAIQGRGALLVSGIRGSFTNVVGLPLEILEDLFGRLGYSLWQYVL